MAVNDLTLAESTEIVLEANGASTIDDAFTQADDANLTVANVGGYPMLAVEFEGTYATAPDVGSVVNVYARAINFEGTDDAVTPQADFPHTFVAAIPLNDQTAQQNYRAARVAHPLPLQECEFYIENKAGQTLSAGWTLKATPQTWTPATA